MTLVRYNPLTNFVPGTFGDLIESALRETRHNVFIPQADIIKGEKQFELHLMVPGMNKQDFIIDLNENQLTISGERKDTVNEGQKFVKKESKFGAFERTFTLSDQINKEKISAAYENGILKLTLPILDKKENKAIIKVN